MAIRQNQNNESLEKIIGKLSACENLNRQEAQLGASEIFEKLKNNKPNTLALLAAFFGGLTIKKPSIDELCGINKAMDTTKTFEFRFNINKPIVTAGGTGGDTTPTINVTTPATIIAAAAGACVIKSGTKSFSSKTGCIDLAETWGINAYADRKVVQDCIEKLGTAIWASEGIYPWMKPLIKIASEESAPEVMPMLYSLRLGIATALNPFSLKRQVRGVSKPFTETIANVLLKSGYEKALVVLGYGENEANRIDEFSVLGKNVVSEVKPNGSVETYEVYPEDIGSKRGRIQEIIYPGSYSKNAQLVTNVLLGKDKSTRRDLFLLNAASILYVADEAKDLKDGYELAAQAVNEGRAIEKLKQLVKLSNGQPELLDLILNSL
jgi:anthranilate phosphoribosyltransferase